MAQPPSELAVRPLRRGDPPKLGAVRLAGVLWHDDSGVVYAGDLGAEPAVVVVLSAGAEVDSLARARFHDALAGCGPSRTTVGPLAWGEEPDVAPWAALPAPSWRDGLDRARDLLSTVALGDIGTALPARGPWFRPHWFHRRGVGRWRVWPLPWPTRLSSAGRWTFVASFALVLAIAAVALFIAVRLLQNQGPAPLPPPYPQPTPSPTSTPSPPSPNPSPSPRSTPPGGPNGGGPTAPGGGPPFV